MINLTTLINQIDKKFFPYEAWNNLWTTHPIWNIAAGRSLDSLTTRPLLQRPEGDERCVHWTLPSVHFNGLLWSIILGAELRQEFKKIFFCKYSVNIASYTSLTIIWPSLTNRTSHRSTWYYNWRCSAMISNWQMNPVILTPNIVVCNVILIQITF